jgi:hypothetical protein
MVVTVVAIDPELSGYKHFLEFTRYCWCGGLESWVCLDEELYVGTLLILYIRVNSMLKEACEVEYVWLLFSV